MGTTNAINAATPASSRPADVDESTPIEVLEHLICQGAADLAAAERDWMLAIAEFDRRDGHLGWGAPTCAAWLAQHAGVDIRSARERVRVARALVDQPSLSAAMATGQLSYSKVRAITRVAQPHTLGAWIEIAVSASTNQLERLVSVYRRQVPDPADVERREARHLKARGVDHHRTDDGVMVITLRLPTDDGIAVLSAIDRFLHTGTVEPDGGRTTLSARRADAAVDLALTAVDHQHCLDPRRRPAADALVTVHADLATLTAAHADHHRHNHDLHDHDLHDHDLHDHDRFCTATGSDDSLEHPVGVAVQTVLRLMCTSLVQGLLVDGDGNPLLMGRRARVVRGALERAVTARDTHCPFPGCTRQGRLQFHHCSTYWAEQGTTDIDNTLRLCRFHHRWVHEGGWHTVPDPDTGFVFTAPDGRHLPAAPAVTADADRVWATGRARAARPTTWYADRLDIDHAISSITTYVHRTAADHPAPRLLRAS